MKSFIVSLAMSIDAETEKEAMELAAKKLDSHDFDSNSLIIEEEELMDL